MRLPLLLTALLAGVGAAAAGAQPAPFETVEVTVGGFYTALGDLDGLWEPGPGAVARAAAPFYAGRVFLGASGALHAAREAEQPDYVALHAFGGWAYALPLPAGVEATAGVHAGLFNWRFLTDEAFYARWEAELAAGLDVQLSGPLGRGWRLGVGLQTARLYTSDRLDLRFVHVGVSRRFAVPEWLQGVLR